MLTTENPNKDEPKIVVNMDSAGTGFSYQPSPADRPVSTKRRRWLVTLLGVVLIWGTLAFVGYEYGWNARQSRAQQELLKHQHDALGAFGKNHGGACVVNPTSDGQLTGELVIPSIGLKAPVEQGTSDAVLNVAVGHASQSVLPGAAGTAVMLAHDVSYFVHINELKPGDLILYESNCTTVAFKVAGQQVVKAGSPVSNSTNSSLVLDTCWPTDALFYTPDRLLVTATEDTSYVPKGETSAVVNQPISYTTPAPAALVAEGLNLTQNEYPLGTMTLTGQESTAWQESPGPMALEAAALTDYFGGLHAGAQNEQAWWSDIAPGVTMPSALIGGHVSGADAALDVLINSTNGVASSVLLRTTLTIAGGDRPGTYEEIVGLAVHSGVVTITGWQMNVD